MSEDYGRRNMKYRFYGRTGLRVSEIGLGSWITIGLQVDEDNTLKCLKEARNQGINLFDTAEGYGDGVAEKTLGAAIKKLDWKRNDYVIVTKLYWGGSGVNDIGLSRKHILEGMNACLERLGIDYVDIVMAHRCDPGTPMEEIVRSFTQLITEGKAMYWGGSEWSAWEIEHAMHIATKHNLIAPTADQPEYNVFCRERVEREYDPLYRVYGYGLLTWSPLHSGQLSGKYNDGNVPAGSRLSLDDQFMKAFRANLDTEEGKAKLAKIRALGEIAKEVGCSMAQFAIAWCLRNKNVSCVLTAASKPGQIPENAAAVHFVDKITDEQMKRVDEILGNKPAPAIDYFNRDH